MRRLHALLSLAFLVSGCGARSELLGQPEADSSYKIYVADSHTAYSDSGRIVRFDDMTGIGWTAAQLGNGGQIFHPCGIAVGSDGMIYFANPYGARAYGMADLGSGALTVLGTENGLETVFPDPIGVAVDGQDRIYVIDGGVGNIVRADDISGAGWTSFGIAGSGEDQFQGPSGIAVSPEGRILVGDSGNHRIVQIDDMDGHGWAEWPMPGLAGDEGLPYGVAYDSESRIYAVDFAGSAVHRIDSIAGDGHVVFSSPSLLQASHVAVGPDDRIYLTLLNMGHAVVAMDDMAGTNLVTFGGEGTGIGHFENPCGIALR